MTFQTLTSDVSARGVATVTLNRPDRGNALNQVLLDELGSVFTAFADDTAVRIVVLRGAGKHFCAGADVGGPGAGGAPKFTLAAVMQAVDTCPKPTIAVVHGAAVGGGLALAACCDVVVATPEAFFAIPEVRLGMAPSPALSALFMRAVGYRQFRRFGFSGERILAPQALAMGLAHELVPAEAATAKVDEIVDAMLHGAPGALAELKVRVAEYAVPPASVLYSPAVRDAKHQRSSEAEEGIAAFREKRKPNWYSK